MALSPNILLSLPRTSRVGRAVRGVRWPDNNRLDLAQVAERLIVEVERSLDHIRGSEGKPLYD